MKDKIIELRNEGKTYKEISETLDVSKGTISYYVGTRKSTKELERLGIERQERKCDYCGETLPDNASKFCNKDCYLSNSKETRIQKLQEGSLKTNATISQALIDKYGNNCVLCGQTNIWNNLKLVLQVDHIDGNSDNNSEVNLRLLSPNCHTHADTFGGRPISKKNTEKFLFKKI